MDGTVITEVRTGATAAVAARALAREGASSLAVLGAGAYGFAMASNYNTRPRAAEVLVDSNRYTIVRRRETYEDLVAGETVP